MSTTQPPESGERCTRAAFAGQYTAFETFLVDKLAEIRLHEDSGGMTAVEAAARRVAAYEHHQEAMRNLMNPRGRCRPVS